MGSLLDIDWLMSDEYIAVSFSATIAKNKIQKRVGPILDKIKKGDMPNCNTRLCYETNRVYGIYYTNSDGNTVFEESNINILDCINKILQEHNEAKLTEYINHIDCSKVTRLGAAVDFVITSLISKNPIILIENITELPESPRREIIEKVLVHSWAKDEFVFLDNTYNTHPHIVIFTCRPQKDCKGCYHPVWDERDKYDWQGNILKEISENGVINVEQFNLFFGKE